MDIAMAIGSMRQLEAVRAFQREDAKKEWTADRSAQLLNTEKRKVFLEAFDNDHLAITDLVTALIYCKGCECDEIRDRLKLLMTSAANGIAEREADRKELSGYWAAI